MPWMPATEAEVEELEEHYVHQLDVILIPTPEGWLEVRRVESGDEERE